LVAEGLFTTVTLLACLPFAVGDVESTFDLIE
jgi:hypothetical protein